MQLGRTLAFGTLLIGCGAETADNAADSGSATAADDGASSDDASTGEPVSCDASTGAEAVTLMTEDGVELTGDFYSAGVAHGPAAVLVHMIPPDHDNTNYPIGFINEFLTRGISVVNVNRRGAGGSGGVAEDAYVGPNGKWDAVAAQDFLATHECAFDMTRIAVVGASNGTTTAVDYAVHAGETDELEPAGALVLLSGASYTENQNRFSEAGEALAGVPILFAYPPEEATWPDTQRRHDAGIWNFVPYTPGAHGTLLFGANPESMADIATFVEAALDAE